MFNYQKFVRTQADITPLQSVNFEELVKDFKATDLRVVANKNGTKFLHVVNSAGDYISTKIGNRVRLHEDGIAMIRELLDNYILYYGESDPNEFSGNAWMTWGPAPASNEPLVQISIADLRKNIKAETAKV